MAPWKSAEGKRKVPLTSRAEQAARVIARLVGLHMDKGTRPAEPARRWTAEELGAAYGISARSVLACHDRVGGWPYVAIVARIFDVVWVGDTILPAEAVMERVLGVLSESTSKYDAAPLSSAAAHLAAMSLSAGRFGVDDITEYARDMVAGSFSNFAENFEGSEGRFRKALEIRQRVFGVGHINTITSLLTLATQLSNERKYVESAHLFSQANQIVLGSLSVGPIVRGSLLQYEGMDAINRRQFDRAFLLLSQAAAQYAALGPTKFQNILSPTAVPLRRLTFTRPSREIPFAHTEVL
jgi:hypothetical protein